jgi:hypothetical protein
MKFIALLVIIAAVIASVAAKKVGAQVEHNGEATAEMQRAINAVLKDLEALHGHKFVLVKIDRINHQVVAGKMYHFDLRVRGEFSGERSIVASVYHKLDDSMEVSKLDEGRRFDSLSEDQKKAMFVAMQHLGEKNGDELELVMIKEVRSQVVSGVIYEYELRVKGANTPVRDAKVSVHHHWNGDMNIVA